MSSTLTAGSLTKSYCLLDRLLRRNLIGGIYPESAEYRDRLKNMLKTPQTVYAGFDATSDSLHVGNLATIMNLLHFQRGGHQVICLIGDATTQIGDPSGHLKDRTKLTKSDIKHNANCLESILVKLFDNHSLYYQGSKNMKLEKPIIVRNSQWYKGKNVVDFVGEIFREVRLGTILHKKSIQERLNSREGMNLSEFSYQVFQAFDWLELRKKYDCRLQIGGSDQAGNIYTGHDLIKKITNCTDSIGLLAPLITHESGKKLGKSSDNPETKSNIWLNPSKTSPFQLYQYFVRVPDKDVEKFLKVFTLYDEKTLEDFSYDNLKKSEDVWYRQKKLAESVCKLVHGELGLKFAKRLTHAFYSKNPLDIASLSDNELFELFESDSIKKVVHKEGMRVLDLMKISNCVNSDSDAERLVSAGAVWLNGSRVGSFNVLITSDMIIGNDVILMRIGKKNYYLFKFV